MAIRPDLDERLAALDAELTCEHIAGYTDGADPDCPEPSDQRSAAYRHSFEVARRELENLAPVPAFLSRLHARAIRSDEVIKIITGERY